MASTKKWTVFANLSHISGLENAGKVKDYSAYLFRESEYSAHWGDAPQGREESIESEKTIWGDLLEKEKRIDSRLQSRLIIPVPNGLSESAADNLANAVLAEIKSHGNLHAVVVKHKGKGGANLNEHFHAYYSDRDLITHKKNREVQKKSFLQNIKKIVASEIRRANIYTEVAESNDSGVSTRLPAVTYRRLMKGENMSDNEKTRDWLQQVFIRDAEKNKNEKTVPENQNRENRIDISLSVNINPMREDITAIDTQKSGVKQTQKQVQYASLVKSFDAVAVYEAVIQSANITSDSVFEVANGYLGKHGIEATLQQLEKYMSMFAERLILHTISHASDEQRMKWGIQLRHNKEINKLIKDSQAKFSKMFVELGSEKKGLPGPGMR
jgi:hypothetical protein